MSEITRFTDARDNAELIEMAARLGYLKPHWVTVDPTYGYGKFWTRWRPEALYASDLDPEKSTPRGWPKDARHLDYEDGFADAVVLDGPYKLNGTSTGQGPAVSDERYGVDGAYVRWQDKHQLIREMIDEAYRVLRERGILLVKCQDQVCSGKMRWQTIEFSGHAESLGMRLVDMLHLPGGRRQPEGRQQHARANYSTLLVLRKADGTWRSTT